MGVSGITITRDEALWNITAFDPLARMSLIKDWTQETIYVAKLQSIILVPYALANKDPILTFIINY